MEQDNLQIEEDIDEDDGEFNGSHQIFTNPADAEVTSLIDRINRGTIVLQPDFQRYYVWSEKNASLLIESSLLSIPLPTIYLSEEKDGKIYVIDGQQRLTSFLSFVNGKFPNGQSFRLVGLKVLKEYNGKSFSELPTTVQDKILQFTIRTITFLKQSGSELKFEIFERLNTGSVALNDQELRNCIYRGNYNKLLKEMSENEDFRYLLNISSANNRMADVELVLRFSAFFHQTYLKYKSPMKTFLNNEMAKYQNISEEDATELKEAFKNSMRLIRSMFDKNSFKRFYIGDDNSSNGYWEPKKINNSLFDIMTGTLCNIDTNTGYKYLDKIREGFIDLMTTDSEFIDAIQRSTSSVQAVTIRFDKAREMIKSIIGIDRHEPRIFSYKIKEELYKNDSTCAICGQKIIHIDDSAVDHIKQYWRGGETIPENARLTHRYCNWARSKND